MDNLSLDHVAVICADLDATQRIYTKLGFTLTERSSHHGPVPPEGQLQPWGTGNHCAMFQHGYLELLGITDPERFHEHLTRRLRRYAGLHLIAFGTASMEPEVARLREAGVPIANPIHLTRAVPAPGGAKQAGFDIAYIDEVAWPEADFILIRHSNPALLWQQRLLGHANGARALVGVTVCVDDVGECRERIGQALGISQNGRFQLKSAQLEIIAPAQLPNRFPGAPVPSSRPRVVAVRIEVEDLSRTRAIADVRAHTTYRDQKYIVCVVEQEAGAVIVEFVATGAKENR